MMKTRAVLLALAMTCTGLACNHDNDNAPQQSSTGSSPVVMAATPASGPTAEAPAGGLTLLLAGGTAILTNTCPTALQVKLCTYKFFAARPGPQGLAEGGESDRVTVPANSMMNVEVPQPLRQVDAINWRPCPKEGNPPTFGGGLYIAAVDGSGYCLAPPMTCEVSRRPGEREVGSWFTATLTDPLEDGPYDVIITRGDPSSGRGKVIESKATAPPSIIFQFTSGSGRQASCESPVTPSHTPPPPPEEVCFCHVDVESPQGKQCVREVNMCLPPSGFENDHGGLMTPAPPHFPVPNTHEGGVHAKDYMGQCDGRTQK